MTATRVLEAIRRRDPDGRPSPPTVDDYRQFRRWVIETYGGRALVDYMGWGHAPD